MSTKLSLSFAALVAASGALSACRQITVLSFSVEEGGPADVSLLAVDARPAKRAPIYLHSLNETVGFFDLTPTRIKAWACAGGKVVLYKETDYDGTAERIKIVLAVTRDDQDCPQQDGADAAVYHPDSGTGGMMGSGGSSGMTGGAGGQTILPGSGGAAGNPDAGLPDGGAGAGGGSDAGDGGPLDGAAGECDDGGVHTDTALGQCEMPPGAPPPDQVPAFSASQGCIDYCAKVLVGADGGTGLCPTLYGNVTECQRYCTLAAWPPTTGALSDVGDTIACRNGYLAQAERDPLNRTAHCESAGPGYAVNNSLCSSSMGPCGKFCDAWSQICEGGGAGTRDACFTICSQSLTMTMPLPVMASCRMPWLVRAASDHRYCDLINPIAPTCLPPGCER